VTGYSRADGYNLEELGKGKRGICKINFKMQNPKDFGFSALGSLYRYRWAFTMR